MGYDFCYRFNEDEEEYTLNNISRHNHFLADIIREDTRFSYNELYEEITNVLEKLRDAINDRDQIAEALRVLITVYSEMSNDDTISMDYC